jgi:transposase
MCLTDRQWAVIEPLLPVRDPGRGGRPLVYPRRLVIDSILYVLGSGCSWRRMPHDLAPWDVAYRWFATWTEDGTWDRVHDTLRDQVREQDGRDRQPSAAVLDSQSVKSAEGGEAIGYDAGKRVRGRKRHLLVDTGGLLLKAVVHSASLQRPTRRQAGPDRDPRPVPADRAGLGGRRLRQRRRPWPGRLGR